VRAGGESFIKPIAGPTVLRDRVNERLLWLQLSVGSRRFATLSSATVVGTIEILPLGTALQATSVQITFAR
jgi:hypothetical protein